MLSLLVPVQMRFMEPPATTVGEWWRHHSLRRHKGGPWTVLFLPPRIVAGWFFTVAFKVSPNLTKYWGNPVVTERPTRAGPTVAPLPLGISVDTGTLERVANWSPDSVATVDPCDPGTDPRNGPFAGITLRQYLFNIVLHGNVLEAVVVRRNLLYSLAEVSWLPRPTACRRAVGLCFGLAWFLVLCVDCRVFL